MLDGLLIVYMVGINGTRKINKINGKWRIKMGKYKDALIEVSKDCKGYAMEWRFGKCGCSKSLQLLKELVMEKELKIELEQVKKEWEEEGFEVICSKERFEAYKQWIERRQKVSHHTSAKVVIEKDFFYIVGKFSNKYTYLLTKTFRALGRFDNE